MPGPLWVSSFLVSPHDPLQHSDQMWGCPTHVPHIVMYFSFFSLSAETRIEMAVDMGMSMWEDFRDTFLFLPQLFIKPTMCQAVGLNGLFKIGTLYINSFSSGPSWQIGSSGGTGHAFPQDNNQPAPRGSCFLQRAWIFWFTSPYCLWLLASFTPWPCWLWHSLIWICKPRLKLSP